MKTKKLLPCCSVFMIGSALFACAQPAAPQPKNLPPRGTEAPAAGGAPEAAPAEKITLTFSLWGDPAEQEK